MTLATFLLIMLGVLLGLLAGIVGLGIYFFVNIDKFTIH